MHARRTLAWLALSIVVALSIVIARPPAVAHADTSATPAIVQAGSFDPGPVPVDAFHPDRRPDAEGKLPPLPKPAFGGRAIVHLESMPKSLCYTIDNTAYVRRILYELHETLLLRDWERCDWKPDLAVGYDVEDTLVLAGMDGRGEGDKNCLFGSIVEEGEGWRVYPPAKGDPELPAMWVGKEAVERVEFGTVLTFHMRDGVRWHDGERFDARDVWFSWSLYGNPDVPCGEKRYQFQKIARAEMIDERTVRFFYDKQYSFALSSVADMCILPSHLYDLSDPDNVRFDPEYHAQKKTSDPTWKPSAKEQAEYVTKNRHNREWVGLGPYKLTKWDGEAIEAERFTGFFDAARSGYLDTIRWRYIQNDKTAFQALLNGELDFYGRLSGDEYFGDVTEKPLFTDRYYKGYFYSTAYWYVGWNMQRPKLADVEVRQALARLFDFDEFKRTFYKGLAVQVTGPGSLYSKGYDRELKPFAYDPAQAEEMLRNAGWYDRDGDGVIDKDGIPFEIELLVQAGNQVGQQFGLRFQEALARAGIRLKMTELEMATLLDRRGKRDFDAVTLAWVPPLESDPEQVWHSKEAAKKEDSSNFVGYSDPRTDVLIERIQRELDPEKRAALTRELHARVYELQPYLFAYNPPRKFALNKAIRGFQAVHIDPNYVIRRWYYPVGTPGTRATREKIPVPVIQGK